MSNTNTAPTSLKELTDRINATKTQTEKLSKKNIELIHFADFIKSLKFSSTNKKVATLQIELIDKQLEELNSEPKSVAQIQKIMMLSTFKKSYEDYVISVDNASSINLYSKIKNKVSFKSVIAIIIVFVLYLIALDFRYEKIKGAYGNDIGIHDKWTGEDIKIDRKKLLN